MKYVAGRVLGGDLVGRGAGRPQYEHHPVGRRDRDREADRECEPRAPRERPAALHERDAEPGQRPELGPDHHRADDQDLRVGEDPDRRDQRRQNHERDEAERELRALGGAGLDLLPDDGVRRRPGRC